MAVIGLVTDEGKEAVVAIRASIAIVGAVGDAIRELKEVPSGHLYAQLAGHLNLATYNQIIKVLIDCKLVRQDNHLLTWIGPDTIVWLDLPAKE